MPDSGKTVRVDPVHPDQDTMHKAGKILTSKGVVIFPAQCLYGIAANALIPEAVEKVFRIKQRPEHNPILVLIRARSDLASLVTVVPTQALCLMDRFWPGGLTLVFEAASHISPHLTAHTGKIGVRLPGHPVAIFDRLCFRRSMVAIRQGSGRSLKSASAVWSDTQKG